MTDADTIATLREHLASARAMVEFWKSECLEERRHEYGPEHQWEFDAMRLGHPELDLYLASGAVTELPADSTVRFAGVVAEAAP